MNALRRYVTAIVARPRLVIALVALVTLTLGFFMTRLRVLLDVDAQIPPGDPLVIVGQRIEKLFGGKYMTVIGFYPQSGTVYSTEVLSKVKRVTDKLEQLPGVKPGSVLSLMSPRVKDVKSSADSLEITPLADKVPATDAELGAFRARVQANSFLTSLFVSDDGRATSVLVDFSDFEKAGGSKLLFDKLEAIVGPERAPDLEIVAAGAPTVLHWLLIYTRRVALLFVLALAMIGYLHYRAFRTLQGMIIPLVTAIMGVVWALGLMGLLHAPMDPWNIMTPILLLAIGAGHSVQILKRYYEEYNRLHAERGDLPATEHNRLAVIEATTKVGLVMLAAGTIAALSFGSLATFGLPTIKNFGLCTAFGIVAALTVEMTFIPAIRVLMSPPSERQTEREKREEYFDPILEKLAATVRAGRERPIVWAFAGLIIVALIGVARLEAGNDLHAQFFERNAPVHGFRMADARLAGTRVIQVLVEGNAPDAIKNPEVLKRMDQLGTFIAHQPLPVGKVVSIVDLLKQISLAIDPSGGGKLPDTEQGVAQYLLLYGMGGEEEDLARVVDRPFQRAVITAYLKTDDFRAMKAMTLAMKAEANRLFAGTAVTASVGGGVTNVIALNETMVHGKTINLIQISILVVLITAVLLRSFVGGLLVLLPLATAALVNLGLMGWTGILLSMGTAAISAMAVGIGADYAVYFIFRVREEFQRTGDLREATATALTTSGKAIAYVASAVAGGYLCLALSFFKVHVLLGVLVALTMVTSSAATVAFLPSVILLVTPRFLRRGVARPQPAEVRRAV
ncbi:MAG TPA: MMPL family transporter [Polyangia bacterium]|nr:MMPL family transporter [Polyangia bacterium]